MINQELCIQRITLWRAEATETGEEEKRDSLTDFHSSQFIHGTNFKLCDWPKITSSVGGSLKPRKDSIKGFDGFPFFCFDYDYLKEKKWVEEILK